MCYDACVKNQNPPEWPMSCRLKVAGCKLSPSAARQPTCNFQLSTCNLQLRTRITQHATRNTQHDSPNHPLTPNQPSPCPSSDSNDSINRISSNTLAGLCWSN